MPSQWPASKSILKSFHLVSFRKYTSIRISILDYTLPANILELCKINQTYTTTQLINTPLITCYNIIEDGAKNIQFHKLGKSDVFDMKKC